MAPKGTWHSFRKVVKIIVFSVESSCHVSCNCQSVEEYHH